MADGASAAHGRVVNGAVQLLLPFPPSVNGYWMPRRGGGVMRTPRAREYVMDCRRVVQEQHQHLPRLGAQPVVVEVVASPPDRRRRDLDNVLKAVFDALVRLRVLDDDVQVRELHARWDDDERAYAGVVGVTLRAAAAVGHRTDAERGASVAPAGR